MSSPRLIAVDWGTTRLRAWLVDAAGAALERVAGDDGIMAVPAGGYPATLRRHVGAWLAAHGPMPVVMAGMVGSRNGWVEAPYVHCPAGFEAVAAALVEVDLGEGLSARIVPGLSTRDGEGVPDVLRGEEVKLAGAGIDDGTVVTPGTHGKWARLSGGRVVSFATFMTGDFYGALSAHTILGKLAEEPEDEAGFARGLEASKRPGGLTHQAFSARSLALMGDLPPAQVGPFLSGLLVGNEVRHGLAMQEAGETVVVADGVLARAYGSAFAAAGHTVRILDPDAVFLKGLTRLLDLSGA
jgi:2-dehydro-3-deoxygalactonokinase